MPGDTIEEKQAQREKTENDILHTAFNRACNEYKADELAALKKEKANEGDDDIKLGEEVLQEIEDENKGLNLEKLYGIKVDQIGSQKIYAPEAVQAALSRKKAAAIKKDAAQDEAAAMKTMIKETKANPTWVMVAQTLADALGSMGVKKGGKDE